MEATRREKPNHNNKEVHEKNGAITKFQFFFMIFPFARKLFVADQQMWISRCKLNVRLSHSLPTLYQAIISFSTSNMPAIHNAINFQFSLRNSNAESSIHIRGPFHEHLTSLPLPLSAETRLGVCHFRN